jgi:hypothetical protein
VRHRNRASAVLAGVVVLLAVVVAAAALGTLLVGDATSTTDVATHTPEQREVHHEVWNGTISILVTGGADLGNVSSFSVEGAAMNSTIDPTAARPSARGQIDRSTTVTVEATFEDGTTQVVAEWTFD